MSQTAAKAIKAVLQNKDIAEILAEDSEVFGIYSEAYNFITDYYSKYSSTPSVELLEDKFGDDLFDGVPDVDGATRHYLNDLRAEFLRENIEDMLLRVGKNVRVKDPEDILDRILRRAGELSKFTTRVKDIDVADPDEALEHFKKAREANESGELGIKTGIGVLDEYVATGLTGGMSVTLFGYSSKGKSWIADLIASNVYEQGKTVMLLSLEMGAEQQRARTWAIMGKGRFNVSDLQRGNITERQVEEFTKDTLNTGGKLIVTAIDGVSSVTPNIIKSKIERYQPDLVIIDYLQLMYDNGRTKEMTPRMLNLSGEIKRLAVSSNVPIISISAVTDDEGKKRNAPPSIAQLAWSRAIEFDSDLAIAVHKYDGTNVMELACRKNRNGELFNLQFNVDLGWGIFEPRLEEDDEDD